MANMKSLPLPPRTNEAERLAHVVTDILLPHRLTQQLSFRTVQTLLAIARQSPAIEPEDARRIVQAALQACITADLLTLREGRS
jgi:uncharacterized membrane protein YhhN